MSLKGDKTARIHVMDIDPYGSAVPFLDAVIQASWNNTLLCVTFTDSKVLCGAGMDC